MLPVISIPLDIPDVKVLKIETDRAGDYIITVESTLRSIKCHKCGQEIHRFHSYDEEIILRHLPIFRTPDIAYITA